MTDTIPTLRSTVLDSPAPRELGRFYAELLDWTLDEDPDDDTWVRVHPSDSPAPGIAVQLEPKYVAPTWPAADGQQLMMAHLDPRTATRSASSPSSSTRSPRRPPVPPLRAVARHDPRGGHPFRLFAQ